MDFDWKSIVRTVAPGIASVFGTPLAGMGVTAILNAIMPPDQPLPEDKDAYLSQALQGATPDMLMKMKQADQQFALDMKRSGVDLEKFLEEIALKNTESARNMKVAWLQSDKWDYEPILALLIVCAFGYAEYWVFDYVMHSTTQMDANKAMLIGKMLGMVEAAFLALVYFRYGTSKGSERKTEINAQQRAMESQLEAGK
jgi:hypothetical protein